MIFCNINLIFIFPLTISDELSLNKYIYGEAPCIVIKNCLQASLSDAILKQMTAKALWAQRSAVFFLYEARSFLKEGIKNERHSGFIRKYGFQ